MRPWDIKGKKRDKISKANPHPFIHMNPLSWNPGSAPVLRGHTWSFTLVTNPLALQSTADGPVNSTLSSSSISDMLELDSWIPDNMFLLNSSAVCSKRNEPRHVIPNTVVPVTSECSDQPAYTRSLIRSFASRLNILRPFGVSKLKRGLHRLVWVYTCQNATLLETTCHGSNVDLNLITQVYL